MLDVIISNFVLNLRHEISRILNNWPFQAGPRYEQGTRSFIRVNTA